MAAISGHSEVLEALIKAGADVNLLNLSQESPLHQAAMQDKLECIRILVESGANVEQKGPEGKPPLHFAAKSASPEALGELLKARWPN